MRSWPGPWRSPPNRPQPRASRRRAPPRPREQRPGITLLGLDVERFIMVFGIEDDRQEERLGAGPGEARVLIRAPLHRRPHTIAVAQKNIITHGDLITVVEDGCAGEGKQKQVE